MSFLDDLLSQLSGGQNQPPVSSDQINGGQSADMLSGSGGMDNLNPAGGVQPSPSILEHLQNIIASGANQPNPAGARMSGNGLGDLLNGRAQGQPTNFNSLIGMIKPQAQDKGFLQNFSEQLIKSSQANNMPGQGKSGWGRGITEALVGTNADQLAQQKAADEQNLKMADTLMGTSNLDRTYSTLSKSQKEENKLKARDIASKEKYYDILGKQGKGKVETYQDDNRNIYTQHGTEWFGPSGEVLDGPPQGVNLRKIGSGTQTTGMGTLNPSTAAAYNFVFKKEATDLAKKVDLADSNVQTLQELNSVLDKLGKTGPGEKVLGKASEMANYLTGGAIPMTDKAQNFQRMNALTNSLILNSSALLKGNTSDKDIAFLKETQANAGNDINANRKIAGFVEKLNERVLYKDQYFNEMAAAGKNPQEILQGWNQYVRENPIISGAKKPSAPSPVAQAPTQSAKPEFDDFLSAAGEDKTLADVPKASAQPNNQDSNSAPEATKTINGQEFIKVGGKWFHK